MRQHSFIALALAGSLLLLGACADQPTAARPPSFEPPGMEADLDVVARTLALGLSNQEVRTGVRDALRGSRYTEHKLVLQDWAGTPEGQRVLVAAAQAARMNLRELTQRIERLPAMDFYAPFLDHRRNWRATADVVVVGTLDNEADVVRGYRWDGQTKRFARTDGVPREAMLMLHPAETKGVLPPARGALMGDVIEGRSGGEIASAIEPCPPEALDCGEPIDPDTGTYFPPPPPTGTYFEGFWFTVDGDTEWGDEELEFRAELRHASGTSSYVEATKTLRYTGMNPATAGNLYYDKFTLLFSQRVVDNSRWIVIKVYETDGWPNGDDYFGSNVWHYSDFVPFNGFAGKGYYKVFECGTYSYCETLTNSADLRVTPWP